MPVATEEQVPKPLTYTLMYHFLWCVMFLLSALLLWGIFLASGQRSTAALLAPLAVVLFGLIAGAGALVTYSVRVRLLVGDLQREDAFAWSAASSRAVLVFVPVVLGGWWFALAPLGRWALGLERWPVPFAMTEALLQVELVVWWLSHLLSVRGLARGRRLYLPPAGPAAGAPAGAGAPAEPVGAPALAGKGR